MEIKKYSKKYEEQIKDLLVELQEYVVQIDKYDLNIISSEYRGKYFDNLVKDCKNNNGKIFIIINENKVEGLVAGYVEKYDEIDKLVYKCPKKGIVEELIVSKNHRSKGAGTLLLKEIETYFKSIECEYIQIDVFAYNENAKRFYYKHDYEDRMITLFKKIGE